MPASPIVCSIDATDVRLGKKSGNLLTGTACGKHAKARGAPRKNQGGRERKAVVLRDMHSIRIYFSSHSILKFCLLSVHMLLKPLLLIAGEMILTLLSWAKGYDFHVGMKPVLTVSLRNQDLVNVEFPK